MLAAVRQRGGGSRAKNCGGPRLRVFSLSFKFPGAALTVAAILRFAHDWEKETLHRRQTSRSFSNPGYFEKGLAG